MGGFTEDGYDPRTKAEEYEIIRQAVETEYDGTIEPYRGSLAQATYLGFAGAVANNQEQDMADLYDSLFVETAEDEELTKLARQYGVERRPAIPATGVVEWSRSSTDSELVIPKGTKVTTEFPDPVAYFTTEPATFAAGEATAQSNIKAEAGGTQGNVGADRVTRMPSPPEATISGVTNPQPVGDPDFTLTDGSSQQLGLNEEEDDDLRDRVLASSSIGGAATEPAVRQAIQSLDGDPSLTIYTNRQLSDNANGYGLPKLSAELVIYSRGSSDAEIGRALHQTVSIGERLVSGYNGTAKSFTVTDTTLAQDRTIEWSEAAEVSLSITVDVVEEGGYEGDDAVKRVIAGYIGGVDPEGGAVAGLDVGNDVITDVVESRVSNVDGVLGVASLTIDVDGDGADDTTTRSDGLRALVVRDDEVAIVDAVNAITVN